jgi:hypothetical protein
VSVRIPTCHVRALTDHSTPVDLAECNLVADSRICNMPVFSGLSQEGSGAREIIFPPGPPFAHRTASRPTRLTRLEAGSFGRSRLPSPLAGLKRIFPPLRYRCRTIVTTMLRPDLTLHVQRPGTSQKAPRTRDCKCCRELVGHPTGRGSRNETATKSNCFHSFRGCGYSTQTDISVTALVSGQYGTRRK